MLRLQVHQRCPLGDLRRFPHGFRWCWSRMPILGTLHVWGVHVRIMIYGCWLAGRSRLVWPFVRTILDHHELGRRCPPPTLPGDSFRWCRLGYRFRSVLWIHQHCPLGGPPSVPSRISVMLVEEAKAEGTPCLGCPREGQDMRLLAGVAKPASGTVCIDSLGSPCVGEMLSSSDITRRLLPVVPAGISFPVGPVDPAGPNGPYVAGGPLARMGLWPHLTLTLLARLAQMLQGALLAQMGRCPRFSLTMLARLALQVALLARRGLHPHLTLTLLARWPVCCRGPCWPRWDVVPVFI